MIDTAACNRLIAASGDSPVVLLETYRPGSLPGWSYLFLDPLDIVRADTVKDVDRALTLVRTHIEAGRYAAGYVTYEAGYAFEPSLEHLCPDADGPLVWFGVYGAPALSVPFDEGGASGGFGGLFDPGLAATGRPSGWMSFDAYHRAIEQIKDYIASGDTYQINFTGAFEFAPPRSPYDCYRRLALRQRVSYAAFIRHDGRSVLSLSPELFFRTQGAGIVSRPMKGTIGRGRTTREDALQSDRLRASQKDRAENVMIVDLIRNDIGRICVPGSVQVPELFTVERYETLLQMTSTVEGKLAPGTGLDDIFQALFPCGSVTGAPKIRSMELIRELETRPRGIYTGAIGYAAPSGESVFSVAIRTAVVEEGRGSMGIGSGIVWDSDPAAEYDECGLKRRFFTDDSPPFALIETMRAVNGHIRLIDHHLDRLTDSAAYFGYPVSRESLAERIAAYVATLDHAATWKVRLLLHQSGGIDLTCEALDESSRHTPVRIAIAPVRTDSGNTFLYHKTTNRPLYQALHAIARRHGLHDLILVNERGEITEGCISNIFVSIEGKIVTPPIPCGLLDGVMRRHILARSGAILERPLTPDDIHRAGRIVVTNAVRGILKAELADIEIDADEFDECTGMGG